jgi:RNA polymerase sigma-70 factor (ECF subfamily)
LQDTFIKIWNGADKFNQTSASPMSWLIAIARNNAIDQLRRRRSENEDLGAIDQMPDVGPTPEDAAVASLERKRIDFCLDQLDTDKSSAVRGAYLDGYSNAELAERYNVPLNTMRTWLRRALQKLKACLQE